MTLIAAIGLVCLWLAAAVFLALIIGRIFENADRTTAQALNRPIMVPLDPSATYVITQADLHRIPGVDERAARSATRPYGNVGTVLPAGVVSLEDARARREARVTGGAA